MMLMMRCSCYRRHPKITLMAILSTQLFALFTHLFIELHIHCYIYLNAKIVVDRENLKKKKREEKRKWLIKRFLVKHYEILDVIKLLI